MNRIGRVVATSGCVLAAGSKAAPNPWANFGSADWVVASDSPLPLIIINGNWSLDLLRMSGGGSVTRTSETMTITDNLGTASFCPSAA